MEYTHCIFNFHLILEANKVCMSSQEDAYILVAGSASTKMPSDVRSALARVCEEGGGLSGQEAQQFLQRMEKRRRFCVEAWS
jgi:sulfite reductase alpha subunit-like flavoprotein